jgi:hypothetical protein
MTEGTRIDKRPDPELARLVLTSFGVALADSEEAWEGEESVGWRGSSLDGARFVQLFPPTRRIAELEWCDSVARAASTVASACIVASPSFAFGQPDWFRRLSLANIGLAFG